MAYVELMIVLALLEFMLFGLAVGSARARYKVPAPATAGHEVFERYFRVQMNTIEQLVLFLPGLAVFSWAVSPRGAAALGLVFIVGRALYARGYVQDPAKRGPGFLLTLLANAVLIVGGLIGTLLRLI